MAGGANPQMTANPFAQASGAQQAALAGTGAGMSYMPSQVQAVNPATQIGQFQNPYESQVVQQSLTDLGQAQEMALNNLGAQAEAANAFGGSRQGVAEAQTRLGYGKQAANMVGNLRQQGFNTALGAAQNFANAQNQANQFNVSSGLQGNQQRLGAAQQLANLGRQSFGYGQSIQDRMAAQGAQQRGIQQQLIDAGRADFNRYQQAPQQGLNTLLAALTGTPNLTGGQQTSARPGLFNYLQTIAQMMPN